MTAPPLVPRPAATVMPLRDGPDGLEVFMLRRNPNSVFVGGVHVFPGGAVDPGDAAPRYEQVCGGLTDAEASRRLGVDSGGLAFWVAAIRECFEEAGLLLAEPATELPHLRLEVESGALTLADLCGAHGLTLAASDLHYVSHWITPVGPPRRYDTRFFLAVSPKDHDGLHDDRETVASEWVRPTDALARHEAGTFDLILPTIRNLAALSTFATVADAIEGALALGPISPQS